MKKKLDDLTKCKLIYSGELLLFCAILLVLGILFITGVIAVADWKRYVFSILTFVGGIWAITDFIWTLLSKKKRAKNSLVDKIAVLPISLFYIPFDIIVFVNLAKDSSWSGWNGVNVFQYIIGGALLYVALVFLFEAVFHFFYVHPLVLEMVEEEKQKQVSEEKAASPEQIPENNEKKEDQE